MIKSRGIMSHLLPYMGVERDYIAVEKLQVQNSTTSLNPRQIADRLSRLRASNTRELPEIEIGELRRLSRRRAPYWGCWCIQLKNTHRNGDEPAMKAILTIEDVQSWKTSFDTLISSEYGKRAFQEFLRTEYSEENLCFWLACEELRTLVTTNEQAVEDKARMIYEDYISILSPKEVSLDARVREIINDNMIKPSPKTFVEAQMQIYTLMHRDSYPRFLSSPTYRKYHESVAECS